ncbi:MAG: barstar family protein [Thiobacillaceae bacterium]
MTRLSDILDDPARNGVYRLDGPMPKLPGVIYLDARRHPTKEDLLKALGKALHFPEYYGANWDAFEECLRDLSWWKSPIFVAIEHANALSPADLDTLIDIWSEAATVWAEEGRGCVLLLDSRSGPSLPTATVG